MPPENEPDPDLAEMEYARLVRHMEAASAQAIEVAHLADKAILALSTIPGLGDVNRARAMKKALRAASRSIDSALRRADQMRDHVAEANEGRRELRSILEGRCNPEEGDDPPASAGGAGDPTTFLIVVEPDGLRVGLPIEKFKGIIERAPIKDGRHLLPQAVLSALAAGFRIEIDGRTLLPLTPHQAIMAKASGNIPPFDRIVRID